MGLRYSEEQESYQRAAEIANELLHEGLPLIRFGGDPTHVWMTFQLEDGSAAYSTRLPVREASAERFKEAYEVVA